MPLTLTDTLTCPALTTLRHALLTTTLGLSALFTSPAHAIDIWHSNTVFVNQGQCAATLTLDSGLDEFKQVRLQVAVLDSAGRRVLTQTLEVPTIGASAAERFAETFLEGEAVCEARLQLQITSASALVNGKRIDLLRTGQLTPRGFHPMPIKVSAAPAAASAKPASQPTAPAGRVVDIHLTAAPQLTEEGIHLRTAEGQYAMYAVYASQPVVRAFQKARGGQCLRLHVKAGFDFSDAQGIQRVEVGCR